MGRKVMYLCHQRIVFVVFSLPPPHSVGANQTCRATSFTQTKPFVRSASQSVIAPIVDKVSLSIMLSINIRFQSVWMIIKCYLLLFRQTVYKKKVFIWTATIHGEYLSSVIFGNNVWTLFGCEPVTPSGVCN